MSRIGKKTIAIPTDVTTVINSDAVVVKGPKGELTVSYPAAMHIAIEDGQLKVTRNNNARQTVALHGLIRSLLANAVLGVHQGYEKTLKLVGTGYRVQSKGTAISLAVGFSHSVEFVPPTSVSLKVEGTDTIKVAGYDKHLVGQVAANIRAICPPEPYKGKGIRYDDEVVKTKPGKTASV